MQNEIKASPRRLSLSASVARSKLGMLEKHYAQFGPFAVHLHLTHFTAHSSSFNGSPRISSAVSLDLPKMASRSSVIASVKDEVCVPKK